jgi:NYN domain
MSSGQRILFLIDADNVSLEVIERALSLKQDQHGAVHVRRCYCSADFAVKNLEFLKAHSIRAMVNATSGKNCTDIALAVDAVQLCLTECPAVVVIVASDSDFAPLAIHLRELGCRVEGVGQEGKTGADSHRAYDDFIELPGVRKRSTRSAPAVEAKPAPSRRRSAPAPVEAAEPAAHARRAPAVPAEVALWLEVVPGLASGGKVELGVAAEALRKHGLLSRNASSTRLFKKYPQSFDLAPARQPNAVHYRGA